MRRRRLPARFSRPRMKASRTRCEATTPSATRREPLRRSALRSIRYFSCCAQTNSTSLLEFPQVPVIDVHRQDGIDAVLIIRAIDGRAPIGAGGHLDEPASDRVFGPSEPEFRLDQGGLHLRDRLQLIDQAAGRGSLAVDG